MAEAEEQVEPNGEVLAGASGFKNLKEIAHAKWMRSGALALSLAGLLTATSGELRQSDVMKWAMMCFAFAIPTTAFYLFVFIGV